MLSNGTVRKLKDPTVCRVFYSSPFNGMEGEREELTRRYWPRLASACNSVGVRFAPVDMRWGITTDQSSNYQTINICLREIDRSDLFVGFFGQRYGWCGLTDNTLQMTFDAAVSGYPWLQRVRDRSVTELEFLHGHLNHPGQTPAIICFRDKAFDDLMRARGVEKGDDREVYKYSPESTQAEIYMKDLISMVKATEKDCLALYLSYKDPIEGARLMFEHTWKYIQEVVLKQPETKQTVRQTELAQHTAFMVSHLSSYHGEPDYFTRLNSHISKETIDSKHLLVTGDSGSGKSALLANWVHSLQKNNPNGIYLYHFVECTQNSNNPKNILMRAIANLRHELNVKGSVTETDYPDLDKMDDLTLLNEWQNCLQLASETHHKVVIVIDELQKVQYKQKIVRPLFWLPKTVPSGIHFITSTDSTDKTCIEELVEKRGYDTIVIQPLSVNSRTTLCRDVLLQRGKTLSDAQLDRIINVDRSANPLFLKLVLEELCMFGKFRELDKKIDMLISCASSTELFGKFLERLENDYNPPDFHGNLTEKVMCSLYTSRHGLKESELMEMHDIPSHNWSPFYYAIEQFLNKLTGGFLRLAQTDLKTAVYERYIKNTTKERDIFNEQLNFFHGFYQNLEKQNLTIQEHLYTELPWLCFKAEDKVQLEELITSVPVFLKLLSLQQYELLEYVDFLGHSNDEIIIIFDRAAKVHMADLYIQQQEEDLVSHPNAVKETISVLDSYAVFFNTARKAKVEEFFLLRIKNLTEKCQTLTQSYRDQFQNSIFYRLACLYVDIKEQSKALPLHLAVVKYYENKRDKTDGETVQLANSYHGTGTAYMLLKQFDKAEQYFNDSIRIHSTLPHLKQTPLNICKSLSCIAQLQAEQGNFEAARDKYEELIRSEEKLYKYEMPPEMSYTMTNLGICYRRLDQFAEAEEVYKKALKIKVNAVGHNHFDVAYAYFNLSNLARDRKLYDEALQHLRTTLEIFTNIDFADSVDAIYAKENVALIYMQQQNMVNGLPFFWDIFKYMSEHDQLDLGLPVVFDNYMIHLLRTNDHSGVKKVAKAMIRCEKMRSFLPFLFLHYVDRLNPSDDGLEISSNESIDRAIQLYPDKKDLVFQKIELDLLPNKDMTGINELLEMYLNRLEKFDEMLIIQTADLFESKDWLDGVIGLYEYWLTKHSQNESMLRNLAVAYCTTKQLDKAMKRFQQAADVNPNEPVLKDKVAYLSLCIGDLETCKAAIKELETNWPDNEALMKQLELYKEEICKQENE